jgi:hypothetical protein
MSTCELCEEAPADGDDPFCALCRIEITAMSQVISDPVELILSAHRDLICGDGWTTCLCGERIAGGPAHFRRHVAVLIRDALGLSPPAAWVPAVTAGEESTE